jgi:hypothetical protein
MANKPVLQGGVQNYLGKQKQVTAPVKWKSSPDHPETELAYITKAEKDLLVKSDLHGSLKGGVNKGPSGIMSLNGYGSADESQNVSGAAASAAETGSRNERDRAEVQAEFQRGSTGPALAPGVTPETARDFRSAAIAAGAGQRVNPGFFDSRNVISPEELARARAFTRDRQNRFARDAMRRTRGGGLMNFITGGGFLGNIFRGLGRRFGLGKDYDEATYDMSEFNKLGLGGIDPFANLDIRDKFDRRGNNVTSDLNTVAPLAVNNVSPNISPNVNLLAQPAYNLDGTVRDNAFGYFDLPDGYFDTNTNNINRNINDQIVPGGILDNVDIIDMQENENFGPMA